MIYFFLGAAKIKLENKGDLSFFMKQDDIVSTRFGLFLLTIPRCTRVYWVLLEIYCFISKHMYLTKKHYIIFKLVFGMKLIFKFVVAAYDLRSCM